MLGKLGKCKQVLAAPQGFEPRYADPESAVLPLNEGAATYSRLALHEPLSILWAALIPVNGPAL